MCLQICFESFFVCFSHSQSTSMWCNYVQDVPCSTGIMSDYTVRACCSLKGFYLRHDTLWQEGKRGLVFIKRGIKSLKHKKFCQILFPHYRKYLSIEMWNFSPLPSFLLHLTLPELSPHSLPLLCHSLSSIERLRQMQPDISETGI